jgi:tetratricopeptide (TPR) repeat protein
VAQLFRTTNVTPASLRLVSLTPSGQVLLHNFAQFLLSIRADGAREGAHSRRASGEDSNGQICERTLSGSKETAQRSWDSGRAKVMFERVLALQPNAVASLNGLGCLYLDAGQTAAARQELEKALRLQPADAVTCCNLAMVEFKEGGHDTARRLYRQAIDIDPSNAVALCNLSDLLRRETETRAEAYTLLERAMAHSPDNTHAMMSLSLLLAEDGRRAEAMDMVGEAHELDPSDVPLATHYALLLEGRSFPQLPSLRETHMLNHDDAVLLGGGGSTAPALHHPVRSVGGDDDNHEAEIEGRAGDAGEYERGLVEGPVRSSAGDAAADDERVLLRDVEAEQDEYLSKPPNRTPREQVDVEKAIQVLETALTARRGGVGVRGKPSTGQDSLHADGLALSLLARMRREGGAADATLGRRLVQAAACMPRDPATAAALARALMAGPLFDYDNALDILEHAIKAHPSNPELVSAEAVALAMGGYDEAGDALERALEMNPADVSCLASYGVWLKGEGDYEGAEASYKAALRLNPGDPIIMVNMAVLLEKWQGDWDMAHIWYKRTLQVDPTNQRALLARGRIFEDVLLDMDAARDFYTQAGVRGCAMCVCERARARACMCVCARAHTHCVCARTRVNVYTYHTLARARAHTHTHTHREQPELGR